MSHMNRFPSRNTRNGCIIRYKIQWNPQRFRSVPFKIIWNEFQHQSGHHRLWHIPFDTRVPRVCPSMPEEAGGVFPKPAIYGSIVRQAHHIRTAGRCNVCLQYQYHLLFIRHVARPYVT